MSSLLLLVDLQRDYLASPGLEPAPGSVVRNAAALLERCRELGMPVAHVWTTVSRDDDRRMPHWKREGRWLCEEGTPGHEPPPALAPRAGEPVVHKTSFSGFRNGALDELLRGTGATRLIVAGVHVHACVRQAVLDAYERDAEEIWVAEDATASDDPLHAAITKRYLERRAARFLPVSDLLDGLQRDTAGDSPNGSPPAQTVAERAARCRASAPAWADTPVRDRAAVLEEAARRLEPLAEELADRLADTIGKPVRYGVPEVLRSAEMLRSIAARATEAPETEPAGTAEVRRRPLGTVAVITPWNSPVYIALGKLAAALVYGNAVLWKPAPAAQEVSDHVGGLLADSGLPPRVLEIVAGGRREAEAAMGDPSVDAVTITGSSPAGFAAQEICGRRRIPLQAELGGNNAALVWPDADVEAAARELAVGAFALAGQRCTANRRVVVERSCRAELLELLDRETAALAWGDPRDPETHIGPLVDGAARDRIAGLTESAEAELGPVLFPHGRDVPDVAEFAGRWHPPVIAACDDPTHELVQHESFGPLLVVQGADNWDEAMGLVNGVPQGLAAALFSSSDELSELLLAAARAGLLKLNRSTADADVGVPFGGWGTSGIGPPEHGGFDRDVYTRGQAVYR